jgi:sarcosine oxidase, subunit beta
MTPGDGRVLIIGGGLIGCATAWHLSREGADVLLVERGELNTGASGQNAGSLHFQLERRFLEHGPAATAQAAQIVALSAAAIQDWRGLEAALGEDLDVEMGGGLMVAETAAEVRLLEQKCRYEQDAGIATELIDGDAARVRCPALAPTIVAAAFSAQEGHADPRLVSVAYANAAIAAGAVVRTHASVVAIRRQMPGIFEATIESDGAIAVERASALVIAAGAWSANVATLLNLHLPLHPVALQMNVTERAGPLLHHLVQHVGRRLSMKQTRAGNLLIGGGWAARLAQRDGHFDLSVRPTVLSESLTGNLSAASAIVPAVRELALLRTWTGTTAISADQLPIVGEMPRLRGCFVAAGGSAFTLGPTFARLVSGAVLGRHDELLAPVTPARFEHLNSFMEH